MIKKNGDNCMSCHRRYPHNSRTYIGLDTAGSLLKVGECCKSKIEHLLYKGICVEGHRDLFDKMRETSRDALPDDDAPENAPPEEIDATLDFMQKCVAQADEIEIAAKQSGLPVSITNFDTADWKTDDAEWFKAHPQRLHRVRPIYPGETERSFPGKDLLPFAAPYEPVMLVRQIRPGFRTKLPFGLHADFDTLIASISNEAMIECFNHALFDFAVKAVRNEVNDIANPRL